MSGTVVVTSRSFSTGSVDLVARLEDAGLPLEEISQLVGHRGTTVKELVYRHQLRPVVETGATVVNRLFDQGDERA